jgi:ABC-type multidrug transport system fused ATPase/permease subunit
MFSKIISFLNLLDKKDKNFFFSIYLLIVFGALLEIFCIFLIYILFNYLLNPRSFELTQIFQLDLFNNFFKIEFVNKFNFLILFLIILYLLKFLYFQMMHNFQFSFVNSLRFKFINKLNSYYINRDYSFFFKNDYIRLIRNVQTEVDILTIGFLQTVLIVLTELTILIFFIILLFLNQPIVTSFVIFLLGIAGSIYFFFLKKKIAELGRARQVHQTFFLKDIIDIYKGIKDIKLSNSEKFFLNKVKNTSLIFTKNTATISLLQLLPKLSLEFFIITLMLIIVLFQNIFFDSDNIAILSSLGLFGLASFKILPSISKILTSIQSLQYHSPSLKVLYPELSKAQRAINIYKNLPSGFIFDKEIEYKNVSYRYSNNSRIILKNVNLKIKKNSCVGIIGESGSGKSTFVNLFSGLTNPTTGQIRIDGLDLKKIKREWLDLISYVPQKVYLLDESLSSNIAFGKHKTEIDNINLDKAIKLSKLEKFNKFRKSGLKLGNDGKNISGGQAQRVGIARMFYRKTNILIFDEATNALDFKTETNILNIIKKMLHKKTIIMISHKLKNLSFCDVIYKIENGKVKKIKK